MLNHGDGLPVHAPHSPVHAAGAAGVESVPAQPQNKSSQHLQHASSFLVALSQVPHSPEVDCNFNSSTRNEDDRRRPGMACWHSMPHAPVSRYVGPWKQVMSCDWLCDCKRAHLAGGVVGPHVDDAPTVCEAPHARAQHNRTDQCRAATCHRAAGRCHVTIAGVRRSGRIMAPNGTGQLHLLLA